MSEPLVWEATDEPTLRALAITGRSKRCRSSALRGLLATLTILRKRCVNVSGTS